MNNGWWSLVMMIVFYISILGTKTVALTVEDQPSLSLPLAVNIINQVITYQTVDTTPACLSLNLQICGGTQNISKSYICEQYIDGIKNESYVSNSSDCAPLADMNPVSCQSPAGQITNPVSNGTQTLSCSQGSTTQTFVSVSCNSNYHAVGQNCVEDVVTYTPSYGSYGACSINDSVACSGTGVKTRSITSCQKILNGQPVAGGQISDCSSFDIPSNTEIACQSPSGNYVESILGGNLSYNCGQGVSSSEITPTVLCDEGYTPNQFQQNCEENLTAPLLRLGESRGGFNSAVNAMAKQSDGKLIVVGNFTNYNGQSINRIARLNSNGTLDTSFNIGTGFNQSVNTVAIQADNKIILGGNFTSYNGTLRNRIIRLNQDGTVDDDFQIGTGFQSTINKIIVLNDSKILAGGYFLNYNGNSVSRIARLNIDGSFDSSFLAGSGRLYGPGGTEVFDLAQQADNSIIVAGNITTVDSNPVGVCLEFLTMEF